MSPTIITAVVLLAVIYGYIWQNHPARERDNAESDEPSETRARRDATAPLGPDGEPAPPAPEILTSTDDLRTAPANEPSVSDQMKAEDSFMKGLLLLLLFFSVCSARAQNFRSSPIPQATGIASSSNATRWAIPSTNWDIGFTLGAGFGINGMGSHLAHDLAIGALRVGRLMDIRQLAGLLGATFKSTSGGCPVGP